MSLLLDTAETAEVARWLPTGALSGVTTNPILLRKVGVMDRKAAERTVTALADAINPLPLSVPVWSLANIVNDAVEIAAMRPNMVVKVPVQSPAGELLLPEIRQLADKGIIVNATCLMSGTQAMLAAYSGASYVSVLGGRLADLGVDPFAEIRSLAATLAGRDLDAQVIVGSVRNVADLMGYWEAGAHLVTCPPAVLAKAAVHSYAGETARSFYADWRL